MEGNVFEYRIEEKLFFETIDFRKVKIKLDGWKKEYEFIELFTKINVLDTGYRKVLPPYLKSDSDGNSEIDKKEWLKNQWNGESVLKCFVVSRLVIPDYFKLGRAASAELKGIKPEFFIDGEPDVCNFEKYFGRSYKETVELMEQFSYKRKTGDIYTLNFHEL